MCKIFVIEQPQEP